MLQDFIFFLQYRVQLDSQDSMICQIFPKVCNKYYEVNDGKFFDVVLT